MFFFSAGYFLSINSYFDCVSFSWSFTRIVTPFAEIFNTFLYLSGDTSPAYFPVPDKGSTCSTMLVCNKSFWTTIDHFRGDFGSADARLTSLVSVVLDLKAGDFEILPALLALYFCCLILSFSLLTVKFFYRFCFFRVLPLFSIVSAPCFSISFCLYLFCFSAFLSVACSCYLTE